MKYFLIYVLLTIAKEITSKPSQLKEITSKPEELKTVISKPEPKERFLDIDFHPSNTIIKSFMSNCQSFCKHAKQYIDIPPAF